MGSEHVAGEPDRSPAASARAAGRSDLGDERAAERAALEHWRALAETRADTLDRLAGRPLVRAAMRVDRRLLPLSVRASELVHRGRLALGRVGLAAAARVGPHSDGVGLDGAGPPPPAAGTTVPMMVVVGAHPGVVASGPEIVAVADPREAARVFGRLVAEDHHGAIGLARATTEPRAGDWAAHLAGALGDGVVAAGATVLHPSRPWSRATPHDGRVRARGVTIRARSDGTPEVRAAAAGDSPARERSAQVVTAATAAAVVFDRGAVAAVGGLPVSDDLDAAVVELCARLWGAGGRTVVLPGVVVLDHRPVRSRRELRHAIDPAAPAWRETVERSGPMLLRSAGVTRPGALRIAISTAAPSAKVAPRWGDWHLATAMAAALQRLGHGVRVQTLGDADTLASRSCDVHVVLRGLVPVRRTSGQGHVLWIISHPEGVTDDELDRADLVLVASDLFAGHLRTRTATPVHVMLQATDAQRFFRRTSTPAHRHEVTVVAKTRDVVRPAVVDALAAGLRPAIYGGGWRHIVDPDLVVADHVDNHVLPTVYSSAGVVLNDHWATMREWGFVSNRVYDVLACGTPVISDPVPGMAELFEGTVLEYRDVDHLRGLVAELRAHPERARARAERGRDLVLAAHTFDHRAAELLARLEREGLREPGVGPGRADGDAPAVM